MPAAPTYVPRHAAEAHGGIKMLQPLRYRDFGLLWLGLSVSLIGDGIYLVAMPAQVLRLTNDETALFMVGLAWTAPQVLFLLLGGLLSDRLDRRRVLIAADLIRLVAIGILGLLSVGGDLELWHMYVLVAGLGIGEALFGPAFGSIVPDVVPKQLLVEANSLDNFSRPFALRVAGPFLGAITILSLGPGGAFLIDAGTFGLSAIALFLMRSRPAAQAREHQESALKEIGAGMRFVRTQSWLWVTLLALAVGLLAFYGPFQALVPFLLKQRGSETDFSWVLAATGVGAVLASIIVGQSNMPRRHVTIMYLSWAIGILIVAGYGLFDSLLVSMVVGFFMSGLFTAGIIIWNTLMHTLVPRHLLGRVSSVDWFVSTSLIPLSYVLAAPISKAIGPEKTLVGSGLLGATLIAAFLLIPGVRDPERELVAEPARAGA